MTPANLLGEWAWLLLDSLAQAGVRDVVVSPGSRSTPFVLAASEHPDLVCWSVVDERSAAFFALGQGRATGRPSLLLCTSGTAGAHYLPAVVEARLARIPLLALTADRPLELTDCGAPQTIDQVKLFGGHARHFFELGLPDATDGALRALRRTAAQAVFLAQGPPAGAVHLNARARKPLEPRPAETEEEKELHHRVRALAARPLVRALPPRRWLADDAVEGLAEGCLLAMEGHGRGLIVCGPGSQAENTPRFLRRLRRFSTFTGFPILAEAASQIRFADYEEAPEAPEAPVIHAFDTLLHSETFRRRHAPEFILQIGAAPTSGVWERYLDEHPDCPRFVLTAADWPDPHGSATWVAHADFEEALISVKEMLEVEQARGIGAWARAWRHADALAQECVDDELADVGDALTEGAAARALVAALPAHSLLGLGNSLPIRLVETWGPEDAAPLSVWSQRGANGIDGLVSGFLGAVSRHPTGEGERDGEGDGEGDSAAGLLLGDVSFLHDLGGLAIARQLSAEESAAVPTVLLVLHNDGGRIFEQLPVADLPGLSPAILDRWLTPHGLDFGAACHLFGLPHQKVETVSELEAALSAALRGPRRVTVIEAIVPPRAQTAAPSAREHSRRLWRRVDERLREIPEPVASEKPPSFVLLHGFTGSPASWDRVVACLPPDARVLRPTLLGHGTGFEFEPSTTFEDEVERLASVIYQQGFGDSHLVGYSLGGRLALGIAARYPELFSAVTLIGTHPGLRTEAEREERRRGDAEWIRLLEDEGVPAFVEAWEVLSLFATQRRLSRRVLDDQRRRRLKQNAAGLARALRHLGLGQMPDLRPGLPGLDLPVCLLVGEQDAKFRALAEEMLGQLPEGRLEVIPGAGHNVILESPCRVAAALLETPKATPSTTGTTT